MNTLTRSWNWITMPVRVPAWFLISVATLALIFGVHTFLRDGLSSLIFLAIGMVIMTVIIKVAERRHAAVTRRNEALLDELAHDNKLTNRQFMTEALSNMYFPRIYVIIMIWGTVAWMMDLLSLIMS